MAGDLPVGESAVIAHLGQFRSSRVDLFKLGQRLIQADEGVGIEPIGRHFLRRFTAKVPASFFSVKRPGVIGEFPAHPADDEGDELRRFVPRYGIPFTEADEGFMDEGVGLQSVFGAFASEELRGHPAQFRVDGRQQLFDALKPRFRFHRFLL